MSKTMVVGYRFEGAFDERAVERVLERARVAGVVTGFDTGRGALVWFSGRPGAALRAIRAEVKRLVEGA